jgi:mannitol-1-phosphate/altronate dehydrogenase
MTEPASKRGIAHFGVGNFHRAYQAFYIDRCLALPGQNDWGIVGIGLPGGERGRKKVDQFRSPDCRIRSPSLRAHTKSTKPPKRISISESDTLVPQQMH